MVEPNVTTCLAASKVSIYKEYYGEDRNWHAPWLLCVYKASEYITLKNQKGSALIVRTDAKQYIHHLSTIPADCIQAEP